MSGNADSSPSQPRAGLEASSAGITDPPTLLVVDDDPIFRRLETRILAKEGYRVLQAEGADEALRLAGAAPAIDLLLTDVSMPGADGLELAQRFRALHPKTPVLFVSGSLSLLHGRVEELGRFDVLTKSSKFDELLLKVRALLDKVSPLPIRKKYLMPGFSRQSRGHRAFCMVCSL